MWMIPVTLWSSVHFESIRLMLPPLFRCTHPLMHSSRTIARSTMFVFVHLHFIRFDSLFYVMAMIVAIMLHCLCLHPFASFSQSDFAAAAAAEFLYVFISSENKPKNNQQTNIHAALFAHLKRVVDFLVVHWNCLYSRKAIQNKNICSTNRESRSRNENIFSTYYDGFTTQNQMPTTKSEQNGKWQKVNRKEVVVDHEHTFPISNSNVILITDQCLRCTFVIMNWCSMRLQY